MNGENADGNLLGNVEGFEFWVQLVVFDGLEGGISAWAMSLPWAWMLTDSEKAVCGM